MPPRPENPPVMTRGSMAGAVVEHVREAVIEGRMAPGEWYSVYRLADELGVSRSPAREGLLRLEEAGLIRFAKNRGFQVVPTTPEDVAEIFCIRASLEVPAAGRAGQARDAAVLARIADLRSAMDAAAADGDERVFFEHDRMLHSEILVAAGLNRGRRVVDTLRDSTRLLGASTSAGLRTLDDISTEHDPIIEAIIAGDIPGAREAMEYHLAETGRLLVHQAVQRSGRTDDPDELWTTLTEGFYRQGRPA